MTPAKKFTRLDGLEAVPAHLRGAVVAIGNFDGCHRGHQAVFAEALRLARARGVPALVLTFEPHPRDVFAPKPFLYRLSGPDAKAELVAALGFDGLVILKFDRELAGVAPDRFIADTLVDALAVSGAVVGADFHFGKARAGTPAYLAEAGSAKGFSVTVLPMLVEGDDHVSSTRIRAALEAGDVETANRLLGYHHFFSGVVVPGDRRGRELGYPTANIAMPATTGLFQGVYAVKLRVGGEVFGGVAAYGKPMFDDAPPPFETFIFDFDRDIYGETVTVALLNFLRPSVKFEGLAALIAQMDRDAEAARITIARAAPLSELDAALGFVVG